MLHKKGKLHLHTYPKQNVLELQASREARAARLQPQENHITSLKVLRYNGTVRWGVGLPR